MRIAALIPLLLLLAGGCAKPLVADPASTATGREQLYNFEEKDVTLVGKTDFIDSEKYRGPAVIIDDKTPVRVPEVRNWPKSIKGDEITIRGRLRRYTPTGGKGASPDEWFVLEAVRWQKGDLSPKSP